MLSAFKKILVLQPDNTVREVTIGVQSPYGPTYSNPNSNLSVLSPQQQQTSDRIQPLHSSQISKQLELPDRIYRKPEEKAFRQPSTSASPINNKLLKIKKFFTEKPLFFHVLLAIVTVVLIITVVLLILFATSMLYSEIPWYLLKSLSKIFFY